jgi:aspartyl aminopeptidase
MSDHDERAVGPAERFFKSHDERRPRYDQGIQSARDLAAFIDASPTPFHAVREAARRLEAAGFRELIEADPWTIAPGDLRFVIRGGSTLLAFVVGTESPARAGYRMIAAHTDSPNLRIKPNADRGSRGYAQVGVEIYGSPLYSTWLDRDLGIAGQVVLRGTSGVEPRLLRLDRKVARIPSLAIHLNRGVNTDGLVLNAQKHMVPILGLESQTSLRKVLAHALDVDPATILSFDLSLYDTENAAIGGLDDELVFASRLDNLVSCHAATTALASRTTPCPATRLIVLFDHEECGSRSAVGAAGTLVRDSVARLLDRGPAAEPQAQARAMARSLLISSDMAHAVHPNYESQHDEQHMPGLNRGLVIKSNVNQSYATSADTAARFELFCQEAGFEPQRFVVRSDLPCGSTIGPIAAAGLGIPTVDVGAPMLAMHSCREMCGTLDVYWGIETFKAALGG